jgi:hypothetical protein
LQATEKQDNVVTCLSAWPEDTTEKKERHNSEEKGQKPNFPAQVSPPFNEHPMSCAFLYGCVYSFVTRQISGAGNSYFENQSVLIPRPLDFFVRLSVLLLKSIIKSAPQTF